MSCPGLKRERSHAWAAPPRGLAGPARLCRAQRLLPGPAGLHPGVTECPRKAGLTSQVAVPGAGRGAGVGRGPRCRELTLLLSPPKEMLQEKSLSETEEGFPTAPAPGHADTSAGSPVLGVAGGSSTPLSSPQLPDPEQVRSVRPRSCPAAPSPPPPARPAAAHLAEEGLRGKLVFLHFSLLLFFIVIILFSLAKAGRPAPAVGAQVCK